MFIYKLTQDWDQGDHAISSLIVVAENAAQAEMMHPGQNGKEEYDFSKDPWNDGYLYHNWVKNPSQVKVEIIGKAFDRVPRILK